MALGVDEMPAGRVVRKTLLLTLGTLGFVFCLTLMFLSMRAVMDVGGTCASGGPFEVRQECPDDVAWLMPVSIFGGLASLGVGALGVFSQGGPRPYAFAWSALFLSLGWNFLEYGLDPPGADGLVWGWLACAIVFGLMGGLPLLALLNPSAARWAFWGPPRGEDDAAGLPRPYRPPTSPRPHRAPTAAPRPPSPPAEPGGDLVTRLERLAALRDRGAIDAEEYERAKDAILQGEGSR